MNVVNFFTFGIDVSSDYCVYICMEINLKKVKRIIILLIEKHGRYRRAPITTKSGEKTLETGKKTKMSVGNIDITFVWILPSSIWTMSYLLLSITSHGPLGIFDSKSLLLFID